MTRLEQQRAARRARKLKRLTSLAHIQPWRLLGESRSAFYRGAAVEREEILRAALDASGDASV